MIRREATKANHPPAPNLGPTLHLLIPHFVEARISPSDEGLLAPIGLAEK